MGDPSRYVDVWQTFSNSRDAHYHCCAQYVEALVSVDDCMSGLDVHFRHRFQVVSFYFNSGDGEGKQSIYAIPRLKAEILSVLLDQGREAPRTGREAKANWVFENRVTLNKVFMIDAGEKEIQWVRFVKDDIHRKIGRLIITMLTCRWPQMMITSGA